MPEITVNVDPTTGYSGNDGVSIYVTPYQALSTTPETAAANSHRMYLDSGKLHSVPRNYYYAVGISQLGWSYALIDVDVPMGYVPGHAICVSMRIEQVGVVGSGAEASILQVCFIRADDGSAIPMGSLPWPNGTKSAQSDQSSYVENPPGAGPATYTFTTPDGEMSYTTVGGGASGTEGIQPGDVLTLQIGTNIFAPLSGGATSGSPMTYSLIDNIQVVFNCGDAGGGYCQGHIF